VKILTWNLNHRAARRAIPLWVSRAIVAEAPDVVVLTEYVVGADHDRFLGGLAGAGLCYTAVTLRVERGNQVLVAARQPIQPGLLVAPDFHPSVRPNFHHVRLVVDDIEVIGFRMPAFAGPERPMKRRTWDWLITALRKVHDRQAIILGDFNTASGDSTKTCGDCIELLVTEGWTPQVPAEGYSWRRASDTVGRRIDLAFTSPKLVGAGATYSWAFQILASDAASGWVGRPDHAMLFLEAEPLPAFRQVAG
jgi:exonuclease III